MFTINVTDEEFEHIAKLRKERATDAVEKLLEGEFNAALTDALELELADLEKEFKKTLEQVSKEIDVQARVANAAILTAIQLSEQHGIPFTIDLEVLPKARQYVPETFSRRWSELGEGFFEDLGIENFSEPGWDYWNTSSLSC